MMHMISGTLHSLSQAVMDDENNDSVKFNLFIKTNEIKQIIDSLQSVMLLPKKDREKWVTDHEEHVNRLLDTFMNDASLALDGLYLDNEALKLSMDYVTSLRDAMNTLHSILYEHRKLDT